MDRGFEENTCQFTSEKPIVLSSPGRCTRLWVRTGLEHRMGDEINFGCTGPGGKWSQEPSNRSGLFSVSSPPRETTSSAPVCRLLGWQTPHGHPVFQSESASLQASRHCLTGPASCSVAPAPGSHVLPC